MGEPGPDDKCRTCGHRRELHRPAMGSLDFEGCHYTHPHGGGCGSHGGQPPYGAGNTVCCSRVRRDLVKQIEVDYVVLVCSDCGTKRTVYMDAPLRGATALINWSKTASMACPCGATIRTVVAHVRNAPGPT